MDYLAKDFIFFPFLLYGSSRHFTEDQHEMNRRNGLRRLKHDALPSLFDYLPKKSGREKPKRSCAVGVALTQPVALHLAHEHSYAAAAAAAAASSQPQPSGLQHIGENN